MTAMKHPAGVQLLESDLADLLELNRLRAHGTSSRSDVLEARFASRFATDRHLAVYGSLAPGQSNYGQLQALSGEWFAGYSVRGTLLHHGWGDIIGFPALRWSLSGPSVPVKLFVSEDLPQHWSRLDAFEGADYLRILAPVFENDDVIAVANLYGVRP